MIERDIIASARMIDNILLNYLKDMDSMDEVDMWRMYESVREWTHKIKQDAKQFPSIIKIALEAKK